MEFTFPNVFFFPSEFSSCIFYFFISYLFCNINNQARVKDNTSVFSTSTRNFNNRLGNGAQVFLGSAELAVIVAIMGKIPTVEEYNKFVEA